MRWIDVYLGPPDVIACDAGNNFIGSAFQGNADMLHICTKSVPVEFANSTTKNRRYHAPLQRAFSIINKRASDMDKAEVSQMVVK